MKNKSGHDDLSNLTDIKETDNTLWKVTIEIDRGGIYHKSDGRFAITF